jgi:hypothetical protein
MCMLNYRRTRTQVLQASKGWVWKNGIVRRWNYNSNNIKTLYRFQQLIWSTTNSYMPRGCFKVYDLANAKDLRVCVFRKQLAARQWKQQPRSLCFLNFTYNWACTCDSLTNFGMLTRINIRITHIRTYKFPLNIWQKSKVYAWVHQSITFLDPIIENYIYSLRSIITMFIRLYIPVIHY